jgi:hypothetical protein
MRLFNWANVKIPPTCRNLVRISVLFCGIAALCGCPKPVHLGEFLEDDDVKEIIQNSKIERLFVNVEFNVEDLCPELVFNDGVDLTDLLEGDTLTLHYNIDPALIIVNNSDLYSEIEWYCIANTPLTDGVSPDGRQFTAQPPNAPLTNAKDYRVTVVGKTEDQKAYGTSFDIKVES